MVSVEFLQTNIANQEHAKYVENHVSRHLWQLIKVFRYNSFTMTEALAS